mgnify:FL=1
MTPREYISHFVYNIGYEFFYYFGMLNVKRKYYMNSLFYHMKEYRKTNEISFSFINIDNIITVNDNHSGILSTTAQYSNYNNFNENKLSTKYDFIIIKNNENESILFFKDKDDDNKLNKLMDIYFNTEEKIFNNSDYSFLSYIINFNDTQYEIQLNDSCYNFGFIDNNIGHKHFIYWYIDYKYNIKLPNIDDFKYTLTIIDENANIKTDLQCENIILEKSNYIIN